ncbi:hypothetical protein BO94DRAFT_209709 [Aspergillus sclerotioniger CBS 115572]|uniref:Uncharacterized protein n=1 Tax=Aspergillus sclerotioniger CBS 115572 TaxID=1450535 RepID=A0A317VPK5_9EURO|nr:hypothetical protein BO94DRAFT_209709 [Aspergillus sclerotioniger CBS 115572]PWY75201.1 hypothetical protein BO94DRAFT_209709 [Aspergillus sclerotioniger CBS 115572]
MGKTNWLMRPKFCAVVQKWRRDSLASVVDHSVNDPFRSRAISAKFITQLFHVRQARQLLEGTGTQLQTFIGLLHGSDHTAVSVLQAQLALVDTAQELDMIINLGTLLSRNIAYVELDILHSGQLRGHGRGWHRGFGRVMLLFPVP